MVVAPSPPHSQHTPPSRSITCRLIRSQPGPYLSTLLPLRLVVQGMQRAPLWVRRWQSRQGRGGTMVDVISRCGSGWLCSL